jgi:hypothetical protein
MGRERPSARGGRGAGNPSAYCIGQAGRGGRPVEPEVQLLTHRWTRSTWNAGDAPARAGLERPEISSNLRGVPGFRPSDFADFTSTEGPLRDTSRVVPTDDPADSFKSAIRCPGGFHRFQEIQDARSTLSTGGMYDLYTRYGQSVDKKALLIRGENYPQVPPQPEGPLYRGFQAHKYL